MFRPSRIAEGEAAVLYAQQAEAETRRRTCVGTPLGGCGGIRLGACHLPVRTSAGIGLETDHGLGQHHLVHHDIAGDHGNGIERHGQIRDTDEGIRDAAFGIGKPHAAGLDAHRWEKGQADGAIDGEIPSRRVTHRIGDLGLCHVRVDDERQCDNGHNDQDDHKGEKLNKNRIA